MHQFRKTRQWGLMALVLAVPLVALTIPLQAAKPKQDERSNAAAVQQRARAKKRVAAVAANKADAAKSRVKTAETKQPGGQKADPKASPVATSPAVAHASVESRPSSQLIARRVDASILASLQSSGQTVAPPCSDEDFLRRVSFDLAGASPTPQEITLFGLDSDVDKRLKVIDRLLGSEEYAVNWTRYWRDVIYSRATEPRSRLGQAAFESWIKDQLQTNQSWDKIATAIITATGNAAESGETALIFAQGGEPDEIAAETSRIFLGIQIQCANCHDHPTDRWKREQFHELAAYFPRIRLNRMMATQPPTITIMSVEAGQRDPLEGYREIMANPESFLRLADRNGNGKIEKDEARRGQAGGRIAQLIERGDANKDGALDLKEIKNLPAPPERTGQGSLEYHMADLENPTAQGKQIEPAFFVDNSHPGTGLGDLDRRQALAKSLTSPSNPWFAKAIVNRVWAELCGEGFFMPVDDLGPDREPVQAEALEALATGFIENAYDLKWLFRTVASTQAYQRKIRAKDPLKPAPFASATPTRLRADQLFTSLMRVMGIEENSLPDQGRPGPGARYRGDNSVRGQFHTLFGIDPSTPPEDQGGTIPQALFLMNAREVNSQIRATGGTRLAEMLRKYPSDKDAVIELYMLVHAREPSARELATCQKYIAEVKNRDEAFEDLLWSLMNSSEFLTKR